VKQGGAESPQAVVVTQISRASTGLASSSANRRRSHRAPGNRPGPRPGVVSVRRWTHL